MSHDHRHTADTRGFPSFARLGLSGRLAIAFTLSALVWAVILPLLG